MGSHFVRHLHNIYPEYHIWNFDLLTYAGNPENLADIESSDRYHFIQGDIGDTSLVEDILQNNNFDIVINFTAESHVDRSIMNAFQFIKTNIQGAYVLLEAIRKYKIPRFIYISTDEVYGDIPVGVQTTEHYPLNPTNPYAASKAAADLMTQSYMKTHYVPAVIVRSSNNFGTHQYPEKLHAMTITNLIQNQKVPVHGSGQHIRSWIHVQDFCNALDLIMHQGLDYQIYDVAGEEKSNIAVIEAICRILDKDPKAYIEHVNDRPGADLRYSSDASKIKKEFDWHIQYPYSDSIKEVVDWYQEHSDWWQKIKETKEFQEHYKKQSQGQYDL